ncbi:phosphatase PAP2 family protein [Metabacillus indicus]|uniref:phosphatase PAP2 family protein n=1 Tax=Metabacillus indicus TaxID=246786 RepID=UPI0004936233|nr:phosphatase PAP2 family protein [Metabacillus indicus]KEZ50445.1 hypothetical protein AZ46_0207115 [Metabacillus indicus LMG 22858]
MKKIAAFFLLFLLLACIYRIDGVQHAENFVVQKAETWRSEPATAVFLAVSDAGSIKAEYPVLLFATFLLLLNKKVLAPAFLWIAFYSARYLNTGLKDLFERERPSFHAVIDAAHYSFPSGHAMNSTVFYGFICYLLLANTSAAGRNKKKRFWAAVCFIGLIGLSRVYLGVHYAIDVAAGFSAGIVLLLILIRLYEWMKMSIDKTSAT